MNRHMQAADHLVFNARSWSRERCAPCGEVQLHRRGRCIHCDTDAHPTSVRLVNGGCGVISVVDKVTGKVVPAGVGLYRG